MKKQLEKLSQQKFAPLSTGAKLQIRGGGSTGAGSTMLKFERDGNKVRDYIRSWGSDDVQEGQMCYYEVSYRWTDWY